MVFTNSRIKAPLGEGVSQGRFIVQQDDQFVAGVIVRLPVNEETLPHMHTSKCITPRAEKSALFVFPASETGQGLVEYAVVLFLAVVIVLTVVGLWSWLW